MGEFLQVRRAAADDLPVILEMINEAATWLRTRDTDQWARPWPDRTARDARVRRGIRSGQTWMAEEHGRPVATVTYRPDGNQALWTRRERDEPAVYLSRLVVTRRAAGLGIGAAMIDWAGWQAARDWDAQWIRVDVWTTNIALHDYYQGRGFRFCRLCPFDQLAYPSGALFQKPTDKVDRTAATQFRKTATTVAWPAQDRPRLRRESSAIPHHQVW
jgi:GNAT superfamily N-acetyltransferase